MREGRKGGGGGEGKEKIRNTVEPLYFKKDTLLMKNIFLGPKMLTVLKILFLKQGQPPYKGQNGWS